MASSPPNSTAALGSLLVHLLVTFTFGRSLHVESASFAQLGLSMSLFAMFAVSDRLRLWVFVQEVLGVTSLPVSWGMDLLFQDAVVTCIDVGREPGHRAKTQRSQKWKKRPLPKRENWTAAPAAQEPRGEAPAAMTWWKGATTRPRPSRLARRVAKSKRPQEHKTKEKTASKGRVALENWGICILLLFLHQKKKKKTWAENVQLHQIQIKKVEHRFGEQISGFASEQLLCCPFPHHLSRAKVFHPDFWLRHLLDFEARAPV